MPIYIKFGDFCACYAETTQPIPFRDAEEAQAYVEENLKHPDFAHYELVYADNVKDFVDKAAS